MVELRPMSQAEFAAYLGKAIADYAEDRVRACNWAPEEALQKSEKEFHDLLPEGVATNDNFLYTIVDPESEAKVGILWVAKRDRKPHAEAFVYDVEIKEEFRHKGYGSQAFRALEDKVKALGLTEISLHVFGHNHVARAMYENLGYEATNINMTKKLNP